jgi:hypothetical protein
MVITSVMSYTFKMRREHFQPGPDGTSFVFVSKGKRGIPFLPGALFIALGITVLLFPRFFITVLAVCFVAIGALLSYFAYKFIMLRKQLSSLAKNMESSFKGSSFRGTKSEVGVIEIEGEKIVYH